LATYPFEDPQAFLSDFGVQATFGSLSANIILSLPGVDLLGGRVESNQYEAEFASADLPGLAYGSLITINSVVYKVLNVFPLDDGTFSRARLST
jgi:hypothetical protein